MPNPLLRGGQGRSAEDMMDGVDYYRWAAYFALAVAAAAAVVKIVEVVG